MKGDRVEAIVDTGQGTQAFDIVARTMGLVYDIEPNSVVDVRTRR